MLDSAAAMSEQVLATPNAPLDAQNRATLFRGKIALAQGDERRAEDEFVATLNSARDVNGAEAQYLLATMQFKRKEYRQSLNTLYELNKNFAQYQRWKDRAFLLIADNFVGLDDQYQATATLNSIIAESPDVKTKDAAKAKLEALGQKPKPVVEEGIE